MTGRNKLVLHLVIVEPTKIGNFLDLEHKRYSSSDRWSKEREDKILADYNNGDKDGWETWV